MRDFFSGCICQRARQEIVFFIPVSASSSSKTSFSCLQIGGSRSFPNSQRGRHLGLRQAPGQATGQASQLPEVQDAGPPPVLDGPEALAILGPTPFKKPSNNPKDEPKMSLFGHFGTFFACGIFRNCQKLGELEGEIVRWFRQSSTPAAPNASIAGATSCRSRGIMMSSAWARSMLAV